MKLRGILNAVMAGVVLASSAAMPAAAHGAIRYKVYYFYDTQFTQYAGEEWIYCDRHRRLIGDTGPYFYDVYEEPCP